MHAFKCYLLILPVLIFNGLMAQNYQAIHGSPYAGSLATGNNPASIVHVPFVWDITPLSVQFKQTTNAFTIEKYALLSSPSNAEVKAGAGTKSRFVFTNQDIHLLNARVSLNSKVAIAFGANLRSYGYAGTNEANWQDTIQSLRDFMKINSGNLPLEGDIRASAWAEVYATYARTIVDDGDRILNGGITFKVTRGLAGGFGKMQGIHYAPSNSPAYTLTNGSLQYMYSNNFDFIDTGKTVAQNRKVFFDKTYSGLSADAGLEYILLSDEENEAASDYAYETKIGISLMDIGANRYRNGTRSRLATAGKAEITDSLVENRFSDVRSFDSFNDSLSTISNTLTMLRGDFYIYQPARLIINIDQHVTNNFFINAEVTIPILPIVAKNTAYVKDMNLLAFTPRWEMQSLGVYLPVLFNTRKQLWVGGAFKAGPVLFGTHNLANLFSKNKAQTGGLYLAFTVRPGKKYDRKEHYPKSRADRKERRNVECPKF
ncbi:MAG: hypothetical protein JWP81_5041 [Ferruginibacter sp.]|nr:hypothetical protein [Ferruginibacter sp.]